MTRRPAQTTRNARHLLAPLAVVLLPVLLGACLNQPAAPTATPSAAPSLTPTVNFPTLIPSATLTPPPSPTPTADLLSGLGPPLYEDDFSTDRGWQVLVFGAGGAGVLDGRYSLSVREPFSLTIASSPAVAVQNGYLEVTAQAVLCSGEDEYGIAFRSNTQGEYYRFALNCAGEARFSRVMADGEHVILPNTPVNVVFPGSLSDNQLAVLFDGDSFHFFINGSEVFAARDRLLPAGGSGLFVRTRRAGQTTVLFDDFTLRPIGPVPAAGTPSTP